MSVRKYSGNNFFRQRLILSTLSGTPIRISDIRPDDEEPGIRESEVTLLKMLDELTNGSKIEINTTGTEVLYVPGLLQGGQLRLKCPLDRCLSYYVEVLLCLAPFAKKMVQARLEGLTSREAEPSVDLLRLTWLPLLRRFLPNDDDLEIKIVRRGVLPEGGGEVEVGCSVNRSLRAVRLEKSGGVRRVRGVGWCVKVSPLLMSRAIEAAKAVLKPFLGNVYITADHRKGAAGGNSPGFGMVLVGESEDGVVYGGEAMSRPSGSSEPSTPEEVGELAAKRLLEEIYRGGCMDSSAQSLAVLFMVLGEKNVSKVVSGPLSLYSVGMLRHIKELFDVRFQLERVEETQQVRLTAVGVGFSNLNKTLL